MTDPYIPNKHKKTGIKNEKYQEEAAARTLASYVEVCSHLRNPQRGFNALHFYRMRSKHKYISYSVKNIKIYNAVLIGFAHKGDFSKLQEVLSIMNEEQIQLNLHSYIAIFECLGRLNFKGSNLKEVRRFGKEALSKGFLFDQMMNQGSFLNDEREMVLKTMRAYDSEYTPKYDEPTVWYNNHLVNHLNDDSQKCLSEIEYKSNLGLFTPEKLRECVEKQLSLEKAGYVEIKSIESRGPASYEVKRYRATLEQHYKMWEKAALRAYLRDLSTLSAQRSVTSMEPYLRSIPVKDFITIIIEEAKRLAQNSETYSPTVNMLYKELGGRVYARYLILKKQKVGVIKKIVDIHNSYCDQYAALHTKLDVLPDEECKINSRQIWQWAEYKLKDQGASLDMDHQEWVPTTLQYIGRFLYHIIMHDLKVDVNGLRHSGPKNYLPAFYTIFRSEKKLIKEEVKPHPILSKLYRSALPETLEFPAYEMPMVCPPVPWTAWNSGGYLVSPCELIRLPYQATMQKQRLIEAGAQQLYPCLDALNQLATVPWRVNQKVLDVLLEVFNSGGSSSLNVPQPPSSLPPPPQPTSEVDKAERYQLIRQKMQYRRKKAEMYSLWCDCLYRLSLANHFRDDIFWLPHNMDFRGRVYPVPPHLNHLGSDLARSMLVFAEPRPLGPDGLDWLKIHLVNLTGLKKRDCVKERLSYAIR
nr:unnamed protein product [Callosobruchus chinensis]